MRAFLYWLARLLGDWNAIKKGSVGKRILRKTAGRLVGKTMWRVFK